MSARSTHFLFFIGRWEFFWKGNLYLHFTLCISSIFSVTILVLNAAKQMLRNHFVCETIFKSCANWWVQNFQCNSEATRWLHSLSSPCTLSSIAWVSFKLLVTSFNLSVKASFSSLLSKLMHFGGLCWSGCLPPKCGWAGTGSDEMELPRIWVIINSSCWAEIAISLSFFDTFSLPAGLLHDFLAFLPLSRRVKTLRLHVLLMLLISLT